MSKFTSLRPVLWTENLEEAIGFYIHILGFIVLGKNDDWNWALLQKDDIQIMLSKPNGHEKVSAISFTGSFYFTVTDVDELWEELKTKAKICYQIETFDWEMREFAIYDNNGYILQFGQHADEIRKAE